MLTMGYSFTTDLKDACNWTIRSATGGKFSHIVIRFRCNAEDLALLPFTVRSRMELFGAVAEEAYTFYYESIMAKDAVTGKNGVRGPLDFRRLEKWKEKDAAHILYNQPDLPVTAQEAAEAILLLQWATREIRYAKLQLGRNWLAARTGLVLAFKGSSDKFWTCSEAGARALPPRLSVPFLRIGEILWDFVVPSGNRGGCVGLFERGEQIIREMRRPAA